MRLLLLAGTADAAQIAAALTREQGVATTASLGRAARAPVSLGLPTRIGGWGSDEAFAAWLKREGVRAILDATHPFAVRITARAALVAAELGIDYLQFLRPQWMPGPDDRWTFLNECAEAASRVPAGARVLIDTDGRGEETLGRLPGREVFCRLREPLPHTSRGLDWVFVFDRGPFTIEGEMKLYDRLMIDWIVLPNVGGIEESAKLEATRRLGVNVGMIRRPPQPEVPRATTIAEVMSWVRRRL